MEKVIKIFKDKGWCEQSAYEASAITIEIVEEYKMEKLKQLADWIDGNVGVSSEAIWIDGNVGVSSEAIFLYMTKGSRPGVFDAPSDAGDRNRCIILLNAVPEWWERLKEIEDLKLEGTCNGETFYPWNEQIPLIRKEAVKH